MSEEAALPSTTLHGTLRGFEILIHETWESLLLEGSYSPSA